MTTPNVGATLSTRRFGRVLGAIVLFGVLLIAWLVIMPATSALTQAGVTLAQVLASVLAVVLSCWDGSTVRWPHRALALGTRPTGRAWIPPLGVAALLLTLVGEFIQFIYVGVLGHPVPLISWADPFFVSTYLLFLAIIWILHGRALAGTLRVRLILDSVIVLVSVATCGWALTLGPTLLDPHLGLLAKSVTVTYPLLDCLALSSLLLLWTHNAERTLRPVNILATLAIGAVIVNDSSSYVTLQQGAYSSGNLVNAGIAVGVLFLGLGIAVLRSLLASVPSVAASALASADSAPRLWQSLVPYGVLPAVGGLALYTWRTPAVAPVRFGVALGGGTLIALVVVRQIVALMDNTRLYRHLVEVERDRAAAAAEQHATRRSEERFRALVQNSTDVIVVVDSRGRPSFVSHSLASVLGYQPRDLDGALPADLLDPADRSRAAELFAAVRNGRRPSAQDDFHVRHHDGSWRVMETTVANHLADPAVQGLIITTRDVTARKRAEEQTSRHVARLSTLRLIDMAITSSVDLQLTLAIILEHVSRQLGVDAAAVFVHNPVLQTLDFTAGCGFRGQGTTRVPLRFGEGHTGRAALERRLISVPDLAQEPHDQQALVTNEGFVTAHAAPLLVKGQVKGVLNLFQRSAFIPDQEWLDYLDALAQQVAIAVDNAQLFAGLERSNLDLSLAYEATIEGWSRALDLRDHETEGHSRRVTELTLTLARALGMNDEQLVHVRRGALLHDIGKMGVPDAILLKPGPLTDDERAIMCQHPTAAFHLLRPISYLRPALDIPYRHHEMWDGSGYPQGLRGEQIPLAARIFAVVDVWDALCSDRPYRAAWPAERVREHIRGLAGRHFDPAVVEAFLALPGTHVGHDGPDPQQASPDDGRWQPLPPDPPAPINRSPVPEPSKVQLVTRVAENAR